MSAPGSSRLSSPPSFSKDDSHTILHRMPRNGNPRDLFSCLFGALPFSPTAISLYLPVYSCQARPLLIIYGIIIPDDCQRQCFPSVKLKMSTLNSTFFHVFIVLPFCTIRNLFYCIFSLLGSAIVRLPLLPASHAPYFRSYASCFTSSSNSSPAE